MSHLILTSVNLIAILLFWNLFWRRSQVCRFRDRMFEIRGKLFDVAINNPEFSFKSELYLRFEAMLNGTARYAYRIGFVDYLYFSLFLKKHYEEAEIPSKFDEDFKSNLGRINDEKTKNILIEIKKEYETAVVKLLTFSSLVLSAAFCFVLAGFIFRGIFRLAVKVVVSLVKGLKIDLDSYNISSRIVSYSDVISSALVENESAQKIIVGTQMEAELAQCVG